MTATISTLGRRLPPVPGPRVDPTPAALIAPWPASPAPDGAARGDLSGPAKRPTYAQTSASLAALARINDNVRRSLACRPGTTDADKPGA